MERTKNVKKMVNKKRLEKYKQMMKRCVYDEEEEVAHEQADDILCCLLKEIGYGDVVEIFNKVLKWYA